MSKTSAESPYCDFSRLLETGDDVHIMLTRPVPCKPAPQLVPVEVLCEAIVGIDKDFPYTGFDEIEGRWTVLADSIIKDGNRTLVEWRQCQLGPSDLVMLFAQGGWTVSVLNWSNKWDDMQDKSFTTGRSSVVSKDVDDESTIEWERYCASKDIRPAIN